MDNLKAPFPWFGGKSRVADVVWDRFGDVPNYVEPFAGSLAVLLGRPHEPLTETVNDKDCYLANFWRALAADPEQLAHWADWPVNEADLHARHTWLVNQTKEWRERMKTDPDYYDVKIAGWWVWGISQWIGSGWCSRSDAAHAGIKTDGTSQARRPQLTFANGIHAKRPNMKRGGQGVHRTPQQILFLNHDQGVVTVEERRGGLLAYFTVLARRVRRVRVCCGDWKRVMGPSPTFKIGLTAIFLDPPYSDDARDSNLYNEDSMTIAGEVRDWCLANGDNPLLRIALCGYEAEHELPGWTVHAWKAGGGYANKSDASASKDNAKRERIWFSPACLKADQLEMFTA